MGSIRVSLLFIVVAMLVTPYAWAVAPVKHVKKNPTSSSLLTYHDKEVKKASANPFAVALYRQNYILPYYYTASPYSAIYAGRIPDNQKLSKAEVKGQISFQLPIFNNLFHQKIDLVMAYTQLFYWQLYTKSAYFRETNYEPELFLHRLFGQHWSAELGIDHQSNGQGGQFERSWNRTYLNLTYHNGHWYISVKPWVLIFKSVSTELYNPDIADYLGYERIMLGYQYHHCILTLMLRNTIESGFKRAAERLTFSFPIHKRLRLYFQVFNGYGQSLIEYNHSTFGAGVGLSIGDWP